VFLHDINIYFSELQRASKELSIIEGNLWVYESMKSFDGTAPGSEQAAKVYMVKMKPRLKELREKLRIRLGNRTP